MIVHVIPDSSFLDTVIPLLLEVDVNQRFVILDDSGSSSSAFLPMTRCRNLVSFVSPGEVERYCDDLAEGGRLPILVFHCLTGVNAPVIRCLANKFAMAWVPWGGCDIYDYLPFHGRHLKTFVHEWLGADAHNKCALLLHVFRHGFLYRLFPALDASIQLRRLFKWCFALIPDDYRTYREKVGEKWFPACYLGISYWCYEYDTLPPQIANLDADVSKHPNIMIGNMGSPKYNHREVYDLLMTAREIPDGKIYASFGYGGRKYSENAIAVGRKKFGAKFQPLIGFMPKEDYFKLISSCGIYIADHIVQGGLGTLQLALMAGCKLYLNRRGPIYHFFKESGFVVFPLPKKCDKAFFQQLPLDKKRHNQNLCLKLWGRENVLDGYRKMVAICKDREMWK